LQVVDDGRAVALGSGRQTRLLASLLLSAGEVVSRDRLIDALWHERAPATAANALQVQVHALRKLLGQDRVATEGPGYRLRVEPGELDLERFERLVARGRSELAAGDAESSSTTFREALALWRGPALADVAYDSFAQGEVARLEELRLVALEERIEADLALAGHDQLVAELESLVSVHPGRERLYGQLMLALYRAGRQQDALAVFRRARRGLKEELGLEPGPELQELQRAMLRQDAALRVESREVRARRHLPATRTPLVGRQQELAEVGALLRGEAPRLVTLTGTGGIGKTRLALQVAHDLADAFDEGVFFVDLAHLREPEPVATAIADALGVEPGDLAERLSGPRLLLLLDNFEVVDSAAPLLGELLDAAPRLALLVTSREPLRLTGEHQYRVSPLPLSSGVRLFVERARAVAPGFRRPSEEAEEVSELCRRVDCLPLAIELAAARTRDYSPAELLQLFPSSLELASEGARDLPGRHRMLRATIDWSYRLLGETERALFAPLAVFSGGCTAAAALAVCDAARSTLASLVAKSLLHERLGVDGEPRYAMLETVREYALERLEAEGEPDVLAGRHAEYFLALGEQVDEELRRGAEQRAWLDRLASEHDNFRAALAWTHEAGEYALELRLAAALGLFWALRGHLSEGRAALDAALGQPGEQAPEARALALNAAAVLAYRQRDLETSARLTDESLTLYRRLDDHAGIARALGELGNVASERGQHARAIALYEECASMLRAAADEGPLGTVLANLGDVFLKDGDYDRAAVLLEEALEMQRRVNDLDGVAASLFTLGRVAFHQGASERAAGLLDESLGIASDIGQPELIGYCLAGLGHVALAAGRTEQAVRLFAVADAIFERIGAAMQQAERDAFEAALAGAEPELGPIAFAEAREEGRALELEQAVAEARAHLHGSRVGEDAEMIG
jgi:predicted ATPase